MIAGTSGLPESVVIDHLVNGSFSLKSLGAVNYNGWELAYYKDTGPKVILLFSVVFSTWQVLAIINWILNGLIGYLQHSIRALLLKI